MQNKEIVFVRYKEDRDILINKVKYPHTVYCTGPNPQKDEIPIPNIASETYGFVYHIVKNYDNLPEYTIFSQADPKDHVESFELAIDSTFTSGFGSFNYARTIYTQYAGNWTRLLPIRQLLNALGINFINDNNCPKLMYYVLPGPHFYLHKDRIRERPKSFYEKLLEFCNDEKLIDLIINYKYPEWLFKELSYLHPHLNNMSREEIINKLTYIRDSRHGIIAGCTFEALWFTLFTSKENLKKINLKQASIGNQMFSKKVSTNIDKMFFKLLENDAFDWECPYYLKWREKIIEKAEIECKKFGYDSFEMFKYYKDMGYKHISI